MSYPFWYERPVKDNFLKGNWTRESAAMLATILRDIHRARRIAYTDNEHTKGSESWKIVATGRALQALLDAADYLEDVDVAHKEALKLARWNFDCGEQWRKIAQQLIKRTKRSQLQ